MSSFENKKFFLMNAHTSDSKSKSDEPVIFPEIKDEEEDLFRKKETAGTPIKRINEVDSKILEDNAFNNIDDISLKLELKMLQMNKELDLINEQIELMNIVNPENKYEKIQQFNEQIQSRKKTLNYLKKEYRDLGLFYKINDTMSSTIEMTEKNLKKTKDSLSNNEIANKSIALVPFLKTRSYLVKTLNKLGKIYKKLEEMTNSKQTPWGEDEETMNNFVSFMRTANRLDANLSRFFGLRPRIDRKNNTKNK